MKAPLLLTLNTVWYISSKPENNKYHILIFRSEEKMMTNYKHISVLPCFSKILEKVMYNRSYTHLSENNLTFEMKFGSRARYSTKHVTVELLW